MPAETKDATIAASLPWAKERLALAEYFGSLTAAEKSFIKAPGKRKAALCSRRAGKTTALLAYVVKACLENPGSESLYIALTKGSARGIVWKQLKAIDARCKLGLEFSETRLEATFANGATFYLSGAETEGDIEKFLGRPLAIVGIDECGSFPEHLRQLVREVLTPCLMDLDGTFVLSGTPKKHCRGLFYEITTGERKGWSVHQWTWRDNPYVPQGFVAREMEAEAITEEDPGYQREWCGKWVRSDNELLYPYDPSRNAYDVLPTFAGEWHYLLGVDFGWHDATAFSVAAYNDDSPVLWGLEFFKRPHMVVEEVMDTLEKLTHGKPDFQIVADTGGLGKTIVESINRRWSKHIRTAAKTEKLANAALLRSDLRKGLIKVPRNAAIIAEWDTLCLTDDGREDPTVANDLSDSFLYLTIQARHFWGVAPKPPPDDRSLSEVERYDRWVAERERDRSHAPELFGDAFRVDDLF